MRAREPDSDGFVDLGGVKLHWEVFGEGAPTLLLLPTWTIVHARFWKAQVPYLARHFRVVTYDGPGNGRSDRPLDSGPYDCERQARAAAAVLDASGTDRAVVVSLSMGAQWALWLMANRPERTHYRDFLEFFFSQCFAEPHSTKQIEDSVGWGLETSPEVLIAEAASVWPDEATLRGWCDRSRCPVLVIHGSDDRIVPPRVGEALAEATGGRLVLLEGAGHIPPARDPVKVNLWIREFVESLPGRVR